MTSYVIDQTPYWC